MARRRLGSGRRQRRRARRPWRRVPADPDRQLGHVPVSRCGPVPRLSGRPATVAAGGIPRLHHQAQRLWIAGGPAARHSDHQQHQRTGHGLYGRRAAQLAGQQPLPGGAAQVAPGLLPQSPRPLLVRRQGAGPGKAGRANSRLGDRPAALPAVAPARARRPGRSASCSSAGCCATRASSNMPRRRGCCGRLGPRSSSPSWVLPAATIAPRCRSRKSSVGRTRES